MDQEQQKKLQLLSEKVENLTNFLNQIHTQMTDIRYELNAIKNQHTVNEKHSLEVSDLIIESSETILEPEPMMTELIAQPIIQSVSNSYQEVKKSVQDVVSDKRDMEDYIGSNVLSRVGIVMLLIGVAIFIKYAIDENWISPFMRIMMAYAVSVVLWGISFRLKEKYTSYSAMLLSGAVATAYLTSYIGTLMGIIDPTFAFVLMLLITIYTVFEATRYNQQTIGIFGVVAAYAIPFLLSSGPTNLTILYTYVLVLNIGILFIAYLKNWPAMFNTAFFFTWLIFYTSINLSSQNVLIDTLGINLVFSLTFYILFQSIVVFLQRKKHKEFTFLLGLVNTIIIYFFSIFLLSNVPLQQFLSIREDSLLFAISSLAGLSLFLTAIAIVYPQWKIPPKNSTFYFTISLGFLLLGIIQGFSYPLVVLLWGVVGTVVWVLSRKNENEQFEVNGLNILSASFFPQGYLWLYNWTSYLDWFKFSSNFDLRFFSALSILLCISVVLYLHYKIWSKEVTHSKWFKSSLPNMWLGLFYVIFLRETYVFCSIYIIEYKVGLLEAFFPVCLYLTMIYSGLFVSVLHISGLNRDTILNVSPKTRLVLNNTVLFLFIVLGSIATVALYQLLFIQIDQKALFEKYLWIRYVMYLAIGIMVYLQMISIAKYIKPNEAIVKNFHFFFNLAVLVVLSIEFLILVNTINQSTELSNTFVFRVGYTIIWSMYAMGMIGYGIWVKRKHLRIFGIVLLTISSLKLFLFDLNYSSALSKIIVFIALAVILLLISFLYQKFKDIILAPDETNPS